MEATRPFRSRDLDLVQDWAEQHLRGWGVNTPHAAAWLRRSAEILGDREGRLVLCFDAQARLVSLDLWHDDAVVFGMDDLL